MGVLTANSDSRTVPEIWKDCIMPAIVEFPTVVKQVREWHTGIRIGIEIKLQIVLF